MRRIDPKAVRIYETDEDSPEATAAERIRHGAQIYVSRDKHLSHVAVHGMSVLGALWSGWTGDSFSFDLVVAPRAGGMGIGRKLIVAAIETAQDEADMLLGTSTFDINVLVTNPKVAHILSTLGFVSMDGIRGRQGWWARREELS